MQTSAAPRDAKDDGGSRWIATLSTPEVDAHGDRVLAGAWGWQGATIPVLISHAGSPVARIRPYVDGDALKGELIFPALGTAVASDEAQKLVEAGVLRAVSARFIGVGRPNGHGGVDFRKATLVEASLVREGCCPSARIEGRGGKMMPQRNQILILTKAAILGPSKDPAAAPMTFREAQAQQRTQQRREEQMSLLDVFGASAISILARGGVDAAKLLRQSADQFIDAALDATMRGEKIDRRTVRKASPSR